MVFQLTYLPALPLCLRNTIIAHTRISLDVDCELQVVFVRLKEGMSSAQYFMRLKKVAKGLALYFKWQFGKNFGGKLECLGEKLPPTMLIEPWELTAATSILARFVYMYVACMSIILQERMHT